MTERRVLGWAGAVFLVALGVRWAHLVALASSLEGTGLFSTARLDAAEHMREALDILERDFWLRDRVHWKGPGYSYFLAGLVAMFGRDAGRLRWIVALLGALNCAGLVLLARRFLSLPGAVAAGVLAALNGMVVLFDGELYFPTLLVTLNLCALFLLSRHRDGAGSTAAAGGFMGLAALVHPAYLLVAASVGLWLAKVRRAQAVPFVVAVALVISPVFLKNWIVRGQPVLVSWNGGINLYIGNQPGFDQLGGQGTEAWDRVFLSLPDAGITEEAERDRYYYRLALRQVASEPFGAAGIFLDKVRIFLSPAEIANNFRLYELREPSPVLRALLGRFGPVYLPFGVWAPLAWIGAVVLSRRRKTQSGLLVVWVVGVAVSCVLFFNTARYRVPVVFFGSIWAAAALEASVRLARSREWVRLGIGTTGALALAILTAAINRDQATLPPPLDFSRAQVLEQQGRYDEAAGVFHEVALREPEPSMLLGAAGFYARRGDLRSMRPYLLGVLEKENLSPDDRVNAHEALGESWLAEWNLEGAEASFRAALDVGVDEASWRGVPWFRLDLPPVTDCRLKLALAEVRALAADVEESKRLVTEVLLTCGVHGRIEQRLRRLEAHGISSGRLTPGR